MPTKLLGLLVVLAAVLLLLLEISQAFAGEVSTNQIGHALNGSFRYFSNTH